jgi:3-polyprenyl-4-hydroxybenzoate decarboxylase
MPRELLGEPFPLSIVFGIEPVVLPAACAGIDKADVAKSAITKRIDKRLVRTGYLQGFVM